MVVRRNKKSLKMRIHGQHGKRHRGSGNRGGVGRAGVGKRGKQKKQSMIYDLGKSGLKPKPKMKTINLNDLNNCEELDLKFPNFKLLSQGFLNKKGIKVSVAQASEKAVRKVEEAGGKVITSFPTKDDLETSAEK